MELSKNKSLAAISLAALGIVYGDIGTSPLYAFEQVFSNGSHSVPISELNVLGILSLFFWSLMFVVTLKYVLFIMRADNNWGLFLLWGWSNYTCDIGIKCG